MRAYVLVGAVIGRARALMSVGEDWWLLRFHLMFVNLNCLHVLLLISLSLLSSVKLTPVPGHITLWLFVTCSALILRRL